MKLPWRSARRRRDSLSIDSMIGSDSDDIDLLDGEVRPPGVRYLNHKAVTKGGCCSCRRVAVFLLVNPWMSCVIILFGVSISLGPGVWCILSLRPRIVIDKSLKSFTIPNHKAMQHADALIVAIQQSTFRLRKKRNTESSDNNNNFDNIPSQTNGVKTDSANFTNKPPHSDIVDSSKASGDKIKSNKAPSVMKLRRDKSGTLGIKSSPINRGTFRFTQRKLRWRLQLAYLAQDEKQNIFTQEHLTTIHNIERSIMEHAEFSDFCLKLGVSTTASDPALNSYEGCMPPNSLMSYFYPSKDKHGRLHYDGLGSQLIDIDSALQFAMTHQSFYYFVGDRFNATERKGNMMHAEIVFGAPLKGYYSIVDRRDEQDSKFRQFALSYIDLLKKASTDKVRVLYGGGEIFDYEVDHTFWNDMKLAKFSLVSIFVIMFILTSFSLWLTFWGIVSILLSFPLALFFYRVVFGITSLGILNGAAAFVIIGIGVDDVFVFINIYRQLGHIKDDGERMIKAVSTAGKATLFTSFTTAAAFAANVSSSIPAIHDFALFMSLIVAGCWVTVLIIMPPVLNLWSRLSVINDIVYQRWCRCKSCFSGCKDGLRLPDDIRYFLSNGAAQEEQEEEQEEADVPLMHIDEGDYYPPEDDEPLLLLEHELLDGNHENNVKDDQCDLTAKLQVFMYYFVARPVIKLRWFIIVIFSAMFVTCCVLVPRLHVATRPPQLFNPDSNLQMFYDLKANLSNSEIRCDSCSGLFAVTDNNNNYDNGGPTISSDFKPCGVHGEKCKPKANAPILETDAAVYLVFGIKGIDRSNVSNNHVLTEKGRVVYDDNFTDAFKHFPRHFPSETVRNLCRICKLFANNTDLVKPNTAQCLPTYGLPSVLFEQFEECRNLPKNHKVYHQQLPVRALMGFNQSRQLKWLAFAFESTTKKSESYFKAYKQYRKWEEFVEHVRTNVLPHDSPLQSIYHTSRFWEDVLKEVIAVSSALYGLILSLFICLAAVAIFTGHLTLLAIIFITIVGMILLVVGVFYICGWEMGATEAVSLSILVGSSVDYCVHLVEGYLLAGTCPPTSATQTNKKLRQWRSLAAVSHIGVSILSSAITTIAAAIPLTQTMIQPFSKFGQIVTMNTTVSIVYTLTVCLALLSTFAPAKFTKSWKSTVLSIVVTATVVGVIILVLYIVSVCGIHIPGPSGETLFGM